MMIDILLQAQAIPGVIGTADYAIGTAIPYILGAIGAGATGAWVKNHWQEIKDAAGERIVRPVFGSGRKYAVRSNPIVVQSDATRVERPVIVPTRRDINLHLGGTRAIPVYGKQSGTSTPVMGKKKKARKARPTITRTQDAESTSVPVGSGAITGSEDAAQRDTVRVTNRDAIENATPQDAVKVQHENAKNTEQTVDDRNILQRLGDRWARRKAKNSKPKTKEPTTNPQQENKGLIKRGFGYIKEHPIKSTLIGGTTVFFVGPKPFVGAWDVTSGIVKNRAKAWSFEEDKDKDELQNIDADKSTKSVQNDTTQAYNGFLINQQNLVE